MKIFILIIFLSTTCICHAQMNNAFASNYANKIVVSPVFQKQKFSAFGLDSIVKPPGLRMKKMGSGFTFGGIAVLITGIVIFSSIDNDDQDFNKGLGQIGAGIVIIAGTGMTVTGIVLWSVGGKKYKGYLEKQGTTTSLQWKGNALSLTYHF